MKKILFSLFMSFIFMFFIWCIIIWIEYPDFIQNSSHYHLDLYSMLSRFNVGFDISYSFIDTFKSFIANMQRLNMDNPFIKVLFSNINGLPLTNSGSFIVLLNLLNALINPIYAIFNAIVILGYLLVLIVQFMGICTLLASAIFDFIFTPVVIIS